MSDLLDEHNKLFLADKIVCLIGFMGAGKTCIGKLLAQELSCEFLDMDQVIEEQENTTITEIFKDKGEKHFRRKERQVLKHLVYSTYNDNKLLIIASGGGTFISKANQKLIKQFKWKCSAEQNTSRWILIALNPPFEVIYKRIKATQRPLIFRRSRKFIFNLWSLRYRQYQYIAHLSISEIDTGAIFKTFNQRLRLLQNDL